MAAQPACALVQMHPARLRPVRKDIRIREGATYNDFFARFTADLRDNGMRVPIIAFKAGDAAEVMEGETRRRAALMAGLQSVPVMLYEQQPDDETLAIGKLQCNAMRLDMSELEFAQVYAELLGKWKCSQAELARRLNHNPATVAKRLGVLKNFPSDLHHLIGEGEGRIPFSVAYTLSRLSDPAKIRELAEKTVKGLYTRADAEEDVAEAMGRGERKPKELKVKTGSGLTATFPPLAFETLLADLKLLTDAVQKAQKHNLPLSSLPQMLKG